MSERCFPLGEGNGSEQKHSVPIYERVRGKTAVVARHVAFVRYSTKLGRWTEGLIVAGRALMRISNGASKEDSKEELIIMPYHYKNEMPLYRRFLRTFVSGVALILAICIGAMSAFGHGPVWLDLETLGVSSFALFVLWQTWA